MFICFANDKKNTRHSHVLFFYVNVVGIINICWISGSALFRHNAQRGKQSANFCGGLGKWVGADLKVGSWSFEWIKFLLIYFLNCRKARLQGNKWVSVEKW